MAVEAEFAAPVARLLELGEPSCTSPQEWINYYEYGLGPEHIPALIQLATDLTLLNCPDEADRRCWSPVHAWRALGQLHALQAIEPLLHLFHAVPDNDWVIEEMPDVFALIGPRAFSALAAYLADTARPPYSRLIAATSLMEIARRVPELRDITIVALVGQLVSYRSNSPGVNGVLIANLVELHAAEYSDLIHRVFVESKVDRFIVGDWRDVRLMLSPNGHATLLNSAAVLAATRKKAATDTVERPQEVVNSRSAGNEARTQPRPRSRSTSA